MRVLVMGGTQFNGLALVHELVQAGHDITICNRGVSKATLPDGIGRLRADRTDHGRLAEVLHGHEWDCVYDMTAYHPDDVDVMIKILDGCVGHYIFASSTVTYAASETLPISEHHPDDRGPDQIEYGMHKLLCEDSLFAAHADKGFPATSVAFSMVFGPHNSLLDREQRMFARLEQGRPILLPGSGSTFTQHGHVDDQARALEMLMCRQTTFGKRYNLTGTAIVSDLGYVETCAEVLGVEPRIVHIPALLMDKLWDHEVGLEQHGARATLMDTRPRGDVIPANPRTVARRFALAGAVIQRLAPNIHRWDRTAIFDIDRLRRDVGFVPHRDFETMVTSTYDWYRRNNIAADTAHDWSLEDEIIQLCG